MRIMESVGERAVRGVVKYAAVEGEREDDGLWPSPWHWHLTEGHGAAAY